MVRSEAGIDQPLVTVDDSHDTRESRNVLALQSLWEAAAIPVLVVRDDHGEHRRQEGDGLQDTAPDQRVHAVEDLPLADAVGVLQR